MKSIVKYMGKNPNSPITLRAVVDSRHAKRIIGAQGNVHQYIQTTYEVKLYLHNTGDRYGRLCSIAGPVTNVARAWKEVMCVIFSKASSGLLKNIWLKLLIPSELSVKLQKIPSKTTSGCILNEIAAITNSRITIEPSPLVNTTEHILEVSLPVGEKYLEHFTKAITMIGQQFQIHRHEALSPRNIYYTPFCYERPPITDDDDEEDEGENDGDHKKQQQLQQQKQQQHQRRQQQQHQHQQLQLPQPLKQQYQQTNLSRNKNDHVAFNTPLTIVESSATSSKSTITPPQQSSSSSSSSSSALPPTISQTEALAISSSFASELDDLSNDFYPLNEVNY